ncbi:nucleopolyhedrovirus P10 family protein [Streptomyces sp. NPDC012403]|uniref:nucleopolyhedrovirus P10 family protein n=1 Tax=unclassified Streptomyces TaxID=2593676 RepID=UPI0034542322
MTTDRWTRAVRHQVGLGRILPLGGPRDGAWITERAAEAVLRRAVARDAPGVRLDGVRIGLADPEAATGEPVVPPPPSALPPGPLRLAVEFAATAAEPVPVTASRLRVVLAEAAVERVGLSVASVDLRVTELLDAEPGPVVEPVAEPGPVVEPVVEPGREAVSEPSDPGSEAGRVAVVARAVPGVSRLAGALGRSVHLAEHPGENALPRRHVRVELAVVADARPLDVAREVRSAVASALPGGPTVAVLITAVD